MVLRYPSMAIESLYQCMLRCMRSTTSLACLHRLRRRFKAWRDGFYELQSYYHPNTEPKGQKGLCNQRGELQKPKVPRHPVGKRRGRRGSRLKTVSSQSSSSSESDSEIGAMSSTSEESSLYCASRDSDRGWSVRRRDPRVNGSDIYVARFTKNGMGTAKPCWRCLEWSRWAGVKRIFHWNAEDNRFEVVKVNSAQREQYETHSDVRLFAGSNY
ncbi:unnamed protein product [Somion occarium]|uniref:Uncharacterized protein n=1 Tax=Somion occarium TaxID=3059160 RepID=A0ABP1CRA8_9APHY